MPSAAHQTTIRYFDLLIGSTAQQLTGVAFSGTGFSLLGSTSESDSSFPLSH
jgi:hypothetical protein